MAKSFVIGPTDTVIAGNSGPAEVNTNLNFADDFRIVSSQAGEVIATNVTCPVDQPETLRFSQRRIANVYNGTDIDQSAFLPTRDGTATLIELRQRWIEVDSEDSTYRKAVPVKAAITLTVPSYGNVSAAQVQDLVYRAFSALFYTGTPGPEGIADLLHGVLARPDLR